MRSHRPRRHGARRHQPESAPGTTALVETGMFGLSRNPLYVSMVVVFAGLACLLRTTWALVLMPLAVAAVQAWVIVPEERYLSARFGEQYARIVHAQKVALMPVRPDLKKVMVLGAGPIVIGQACEFDYSGTQACRALRSLGIEVVLLNSNPATIMTDPEFADRTYIEPLLPEIAERIIERERPDALLPTLGGQTALNLAVALAHRGVLERYGVKLIGASLEAIETAEDRERFKHAMERAGLELPRSGYATTVAEAVALGEELGYPLVIRSSFTLGGPGSGLVPNMRQLREAARLGIAASPNGTILIEECLLGWKEFELEVMRDRADNCVVVCSIENFDPMGVHTGDSITVAPAQTLTDRCYQEMRDAALRVMRAIKVEAGGSNIQFAVHPETGEMRVIEMNPRVSRSSALASKATGFPIAKISALLAAGLTLDEIPNDITRKTPACFEPTLDYCVVKIPRWAFEKFRFTDPRLGTRMKSVGEVMAIGRTFPEALLKGWRALEGRSDVLPEPAPIEELEGLRETLREPSPERLRDLFRALAAGENAGDAGRHHRHRSLVPAPDAAHDPLRPHAARAHRARRRRAVARGAGARGQAARLLGPPPGRTLLALRDRGAPPPPGARHRAGDEGGGHLRRRVRGRDAVLLLDLRGRERGAGGDAPARGDPRQRSEPHRPGARVRLLLRAGGARAEGARLRRAAGQLQSRDGEHRLRHLDPALLRAAHRSRTCSTWSSASSRSA